MIVALCFVLSVAPPATAALRLPHISPTPPLGAIDLGPVLSERPSPAQLLAEADRLGADVFVFQSDTIANFYAPRDVGKDIAFSVLSVLGSLIANGASTYHQGNSSTPSGIANGGGSKVVGFYRAFRTGVPHEPLVLTPALPGATLDEQLAGIHAAYATGLIGITGYETLRTTFASRTPRN